MRNKIWNIIMAIILVLIGATFQGIMPRRHAFICHCILLVGVLVVVMLDGKLSIIKEKHFFGIRDLLLIIAILLYRASVCLYYSEVHDVNGNIILATVPLMLYFWGKLYIVYNANNAYRSSMYVLIPLGVGLMIFNMMSIISYYVYGAQGGDGRNWRMFFMGETPLRATFFAFYPLLFISLISWALFTYKQNKLISTMVVLSGIGSAYWWWNVGQTRSVVFVTILSLGIAGILYFLDLMKAGKIRIYKKHIVAVLIMTVIAIVIMIFNAESIMELYRNSVFCRDASILENPRIYMMHNALSQLHKYPFGNNQTEVYVGMRTTHVYWTEFAYCGGIIPFISIIGWLILSIKDAIMLAKSEVKIEEKVLLIRPLFAMILYASTEGLRDMFTPFIMMLIAGMIRGRVLLLFNYKDV